MGVASTTYLMSWSANNRWEDSPGSIVSSEPCLTHTRSIVDDKGSHVVVTHFDSEVEVRRFKKKSRRSIDERDGMNERVVCRFSFHSLLLSSLLTGRGSLLLLFMTIKGVCRSRPLQLTGKEESTRLSFRNVIYKWSSAHFYRRRGFRVDSQSKANELRDQYFNLI